MLTIQIDTREPDWLAVSFPGTPDRADLIGNDLIREVPGRRFSRSRRCWLVPNTRESVVQIGQLFGKAYCRFDEAVVRLYKPAATAAEVEQATNPLWPPLSKRTVGQHRLPFRFTPDGRTPDGRTPDGRTPDGRTPPMREYDRHPVIVAVADALRVQNYAYKTYKNYKQAIIALIRYADRKPIDNLTKAYYQQYLLFLINKKKLSSATLNVHINAYKFYQEKILQRDKEFYDIAYPRQAQKLPTVYSVAEVKAILKATTSLKYRTLFSLVYATGLRLSEVAHLKLTDLDYSRKLLHVRAGKGKKDRVVMLTDKLETAINEYLIRYKPKQFLFEEMQTGEPITNRAIQQVYSDTVRFAGITKQGGIHSLRHSFATGPTHRHLLESGMDIRNIQALLGHESILTTMRYTHVTADKISTFKSPLDNL